MTFSDAAFYNSRPTDTLTCVSWSRISRGIPATKSSSGILLNSGFTPIRFSPTGKNLRPSPQSDLQHVELPSGRFPTPSGRRRIPRNNLRSVPQPLDSEFYRTVEFHFSPDSRLIFAVSQKGAFDGPCQPNSISSPEPVSSVPCFWLVTFAAEAMAPPFSKERPRRLHRQGRFHLCLATRRNPRSPHAYDLCHRTHLPDLA